MYSIGYNVCYRSRGQRLSTGGWSVSGGGEGGSDPSSNKSDLFTPICRCMSLGRHNRVSVVLWAFLGPSIILCLARCKVDATHFRLIWDFRKKPIFISLGWLPALTVNKLQINHSKCGLLTECPNHGPELLFIYSSRIKIWRCEETVCLKLYDKTLSFSKLFPTYSYRRNFININ